MNIHIYLQKLGLSDKEIESYLALLSLGESNIVPVAKKVELPRTTMFYILERLAEKHLIDINESKTRRTYTARPPRTILTLLNYEMDDLEGVIDQLKNNLPEIDRQFRLSPFQPMVRYFKGDDIRLIYEEMLQIDPKKDEIWYVANTNQIMDAFGEEYLRSWIERRIAKKIPSRSIRVKEWEVEGDINKPKEDDFRTYRFAPVSFESPAHIVIYQENVAIITTSQESFGTVITSKEYAVSMRNWFNELWKISKNNLKKEGRQAP